MVDSTGANNTVRAERSNSTSSAGSASSPRRASAGGLFESLQNQKRHNDPTHMARRQSLHEQRPQPGIFGKMWNNWVHGAPDHK